MTTLKADSQEISKAIALLDHLVTQLNDVESDLRRRRNELEQLRRSIDQQVDETRAQWEVTLEMGFDAAAHRININWFHADVLRRQIVARLHQVEEDIDSKRLRLAIFGKELAGRRQPLQNLADHVDALARSFGETVRADGLKVAALLYSKPGEEDTNYRMQIDRLSPDDQKLAQAALHNWADDPQSTAPANYRLECVAFVFLLFYLVSKGQATFPHADAKDTFALAKDPAYTQQGWRTHPPSETPLPGDAIVFDARPESKDSHGKIVQKANRYGHVAIVTDVTTTQVNGVAQTTVTFVASHSPPGSTVFDPNNPKLALPVYSIALVKGQAQAFDGMAVLGYIRYDGPAVQNHQIQQQAIYQQMVQQIPLKP